MRLPPGMAWLTGLSLTDMPVMVKELRTHSRGKHLRLPLLLFVLTAALVAMFIVAFPDEFLNAGELFADGLLVLLISMSIFIMPALTAGSFSIEFEKQTLDLLLLTHLSSDNIAWSKLLSSTVQMLTVLCSLLPLGLLACALGGLTLWQIMMALALSLSIILSFGAIGLFCSVRFMKTSVAMAVTYTICMGWMGVLPITFFLVNLFRTSDLESNVLVSLSVATVILLVLAAMPAFYTSMILRLFLRRTLSRVTYITLWGIFSILATLLLYLPDALDLTQLRFLLYVNPLFTLAMILHDSVLRDIMGIGYQYDAWGSYPASVDSDIIPIVLGVFSIVLLLFGGWIAMRMTRREIQRLRRG